MTEELNPARPEPADLVPHAGDMVLIDEIVAWNEHTVHCRSRIETPVGHPLARADRLPAEVLGEYGAQAMAIHGGLNAEEGEPVRPGLLASLGKLDLGVDHVDGPCVLDIRAMRLGGDAAGVVYEFSIEIGGLEVACGRATVMFPNHAGAAS